MFGWLKRKTTVITNAPRPRIPAQPTSEPDINGIRFAEYAHTVDHLHCCDVDLAMCGYYSPAPDIGYEPVECGDNCGHQLCIFCFRVQDMACIHIDCPHRYEGTVSR